MPVDPPAPSGSLPLGARLLDILSVGALLLGLTVLVTGGFREWTPLGRVSVTSGMRPLIAALAAAAVRHWLWPRPTIVRRTIEGLRALWAAPGVRPAAAIALSTRAAVFLVGFLAVSLVGYRTDVDVPWRLYDNELLNLPARWDTGWYLGVAIDGYSWQPGRALQQQNIAFFPVYPMLMRYGSLLLAREVMWTGVLISWVSFLAALVYLFRMARERFGDAAALNAITLLACYPFAIYFSAAYTESLFLLTIVAACYHFERHELWRAAAWGFAAGLTRPNGCLLSVVLGLIALRPWWMARFARTASPRFAFSQLADRLATAAAPGLGMLVYSTYIFFLTGNPFQWAVQNAAWGRVYRGLDALVSQQAQTIGEHGLYEFAATRTVDALHLGAVVFMLALVVPVFRRVGAPYAALILVTVIPPLMAGGLMSMGRVTAILFPAFLWLGLAMKAERLHGWIAGFAMLQALGAAAFFTWRPLF